MLYSTGICSSFSSDHPALESRWGAPLNLDGRTLNLDGGTPTLDGVRVPPSRLSVLPSRFRGTPIEIRALDDQRKKSYEFQLNIAPNFAGKVIQKEKHFNRWRILFFWSSPNFGEKTLRFSAKTLFFFGLNSPSATELRNLHLKFGQGCKSVPPCKILQFKYWV